MRGRKARASKLLLHHSEQFRKKKPEEMSARGVVHKLITFTVAITIAVTVAHPPRHFPPTPAVPGVKLLLMRPRM